MQAILGRVAQLVTSRVREHARVADLDGDGELTLEDPNPSPSPNPNPNRNQVNFTNVDCFQVNFA